MVAEFSNNDKFLFENLVKCIKNNNNEMHTSVKDPFIIQSKELEGGEYNGQIYKKQMHGHGIIYYRDDLETKRFEGQFKHGKKLKGELFYRNNDKYKGEFQNEMKHGKGI